jgi:hypothetical protein
VGQETGLNVVINLILMVVIIAAAVMVMRFWGRSFFARPGITLMLTVVALVFLIGTGFGIGLLFPNCRLPQPYPIGIGRWGSNLMHYCTAGRP